MFYEAKAVVENGLWEVKGVTVDGEVVSYYQTPFEGLVVQYNSEEQADGIIDSLVERGVATREKMNLVDSMPALDSIMVKPECKNCMYYVSHGMCSARPGPGSINECSYSACELWVWEDMHLAVAALDEHDKAIRKTLLVTKP